MDGRLAPLKREVRRSATEPRGHGGCCGDTAALAGGGGEAREHFQRSGFGEIRTPLLETTDLFSRGIGEVTDVVGKEMYSFQDRGDRSCTLRPEGTASVVRAVPSSTVCSVGRPRSSGMRGRCFATRPRTGRQRQFHQIRSEWLGAERSSRNDVEVIALAWDLLASLGVGGLQLELNSLGTAEDRQGLSQCPGGLA